MKPRPCSGDRAAVATAWASGFTLLELTVVIFIMGLMLTLIVPYVGGFGQAQLRSQARRLAGRATYLFEEATSDKLVIRLIFDFDANGYGVASLDPYSPQPVFHPDNSNGGRPVILPKGIYLRDLTVEGVGTVNRGKVAVQFYPEGYVDTTVIHLGDDRNHVMTLAVNPMTGLVSIMEGNVMPPGMFQ